MSLFPFNGSTEATIDEVLGDSYRVVRDIHANLAAIKAVAMSLIDLEALQAALDAKADKSRVLNLALLGAALTTNETFAAVIPPVGETWTVPANFTGATGKKLSGGVDPASSYVITVNKNGTTVGSITISTSGLVSFATSAGSFSLVGGADVLELVGPATAGTAVGYAFAIPVGY